MVRGTAEGEGPGAGFAAATGPSRRDGPRFWQYGGQSRPQPAGRPRRDRPGRAGTPVTSAHADSALTGSPPQRPTHERAPQRRGTDDPRTVFPSLSLSERNIHAERHLRVLRRRVSARSWHSRRALEKG